MHQLVQKFKQYTTLNDLFSAKNRLLVGVSGGIDSVVLCHLLKQNGFLFEVAHVNFQLRGPESDRDEAFVASMAHDMELPFHLMKADTEAFAADKRISIQVAARELRYQWFGQLIAERGKTDNPLHYILTAHHANDNAETILMNIFRGTGLTGLRGILPSRDLIRRPLLFAQRQDLLSFATSENIRWVEDSSNVMEKYTRNYVRNTIIPLIEKQYPSLVHTLNESAVQARQAELFLGNAMDACLKKLVEVSGREQQVPVARLLQLPGSGAVLYAWLKPFGFSAAQLPDAMALARSQTGHYIDSESHRLLRNRNWLIVTPREEKASGLLLIDKEAGNISFGNGQLAWETFPYEAQGIPVEPQMAWIDADKITYPLLLRPWKPGDYFYPLGMAKKKKVARFLIDNKLSRTEKDQIWVLESDHRIIWVVGQRMDDRFKIKQSTSRIFQVQVKNGL
ncbi:tRNA lysidine(34) synthetase TilS [Flavihumibacter fluvii]|uniref:tRNA lysidine(34) synthetase TilS n=1 Tax=Flavihumibacter fluvii TaxID=2838157 RepID=UPI001BDF3142|nr:tRNA lysidine(34) synthetase TilS [Flavihumibacter fluvii]ULQ53759.1 tRNA lysidine(34) synthetase TilS [Flavihumibacter fluvii]